MTNAPMTGDPAPLRARLEPPKHIVDIAVEVSGWSPCRSKRGVVIFDNENNLISHGHNKKPDGFVCDGSDVCKATCRTEAVHAEQLALLAAGLSNPRDADLLHVKSVEGRLVPSGGPDCVQCSKLIVAVGIAGVWLFHEDGWYRYDAKEFHRLSLAALGDVAPIPTNEIEAALRNIVEDLEARWDMDDPRTNPGIREAVARAKKALGSPSPSAGTDRALIARAEKWLALEAWQRHLAADDDETCDFANVTKDTLYASERPAPDTLCARLEDIVRRREEVVPNYQDFPEQSGVYEADTRTLREALGDVVRSERFRAVLRTIANYKCRDAHGAKNWTCRRYDGTGLWCGPCLAAAALDEDDAVVPTPSRQEER